MLQRRHICQSCWRYNRCLCCQSSPLLYCRKREPYHIRYRAGVWGYNSTIEFKGKVLSIVLQVNINHMKLLDAFFHLIRYLFHSYIKYMHLLLRFNKYVIYLGWIASAMLMRQNLWNLIIFFAYTFKSFDNKKHNNWSMQDANWISGLKSFQLAIIIPFLKCLVRKNNNINGYKYIRFKCTCGWRIACVVHFISSRHHEGNTLKSENRTIFLLFFLCNESTCEAHSNDKITFSLARRNKIITFIQLVICLIFYKTYASPRWT